MTSTALANLRQVNDESLQKFMDRFGQIVVQIQNLNPEVALHSMLLALRRGKFVDSRCKKKTLVAWISCTNEPKATSRWRRCPSSKMRSDKSNKGVTKEKDVPRPTNTSHTREQKLDSSEPVYGLAIQLYNTSNR
ncbi:hypothetical protein JHK87_042911 [Glycine soja]|nr:hypothetical protein JHK87_042911 [Glycine soja]